jgi:antitoxin CptB
MTFDKVAADMFCLALYITPRPAASGLLAFANAMTERSSAGLDMRRRKLLFRAWRRGVREMDLMVGRFADAYIGSLDAAGLDDFERLIEVPDAVLYAWVVGTEDVPASYDTAVLTKLKMFHMRPEKAGDEAKQ